MDGQELLDYTRNDVLKDGTMPYLWSDDLILRRLNEAERLFARETYALLDDTQTITTQAPVNGVGVKEYAVPEGTLLVSSVTDPTSGRDLTNYTRKFIPNALQTAIGIPRSFTMDEATHTVRFFPVPDAVYVMPIRVMRLPAQDFTLSTCPEIPSEYHIDLASFAAWKCLQDNDNDGGNTKAAERHKTDWNEKVATAKREYYRYRLGQNPKFVYN